MIYRKIWHQQHGCAIQFRSLPVLQHCLQLSSSPAGAPTSPSLLPPNGLPAAGSTPEPSSAGCQWRSVLAQPTKKGGAIFEYGDYIKWFIMQVLSRLWPVSPCLQTPPNWAPWIYTALHWWWCSSNALLGQSSVPRPAVAVHEDHLPPVEERWELKLNITKTILFIQNWNVFDTQYFIVLCVPLGKVLTGCLGAELWFSLLLSCCLKAVTCCSADLSSSLVFWCSAVCDSSFFLASNSWV